jgi:hypothetical protein
MIQVDGLKKKIYALAVDQALLDLEGLDEKCKKRVKAHRRTCLHDTIVQIQLDVKKIIEKAKDLIYVYAVEGDWIYNEMKQEYKVYTASTGDIKRGVRDLSPVDTHGLSSIRMTPYGVWNFRMNKLLDFLQRGVLDEYLDLSASELIFKSMGRFGELLPELEIKKMHDLPI